MRWEKVLLIVSAIVFLLVAIYSSVIFYRLRQSPEPERVYVVPDKPSVTLRENPQVLKTRKAPDEPSKMVSEIPLVDRPLEDQRKGSLDLSGSPVELVDEEDDEIVDEKASEYPEVPFAVVWQESDEKRARIPPDLFEELVLLNRVMIKLWNQGDHDFVGISMANGRVYPTYPDVAYVTWREREKPDGTIHRYISGVTAANETIAEEILNGVIPPLPVNAVK